MPAMQMQNHFRAELSSEQSDQILQRCLRHERSCPSSVAHRAFAHKGGHIAPRGQCRIGQNPIFNVNAGRYTVSAKSTSGTEYPQADAGPIDPAYSAQRSVPRSVRTAPARASKDGGGALSAIGQNDSCLAKRLQLLRKDLW